VVTVQKGDTPKQALTCVLKEVSRALGVIIRGRLGPYLSAFQKIQSKAAIPPADNRVVQGGEAFTDYVLIKTK